MSELIFKAVIAILCIIVCILSLVGNALVISVIIRYKRLKNATNYILLSLAIADLTVTIFVMLPATIQDILQEWIFSDFFCKFYMSLDITCCTASILHLLLVAIDRYIAIFSPLTYQNTVKKWHVFCMVLIVWTISFCMSFIPIFLGWNDELASPANVSISNMTLFFETMSGQNASLQQSICYLETNITYAIISSSLSFYIPLVIMTIVYSQIYVVAKRQAKAIAQLNIHSHNYVQDKENTEAYLKNLNAKGDNQKLINQIMCENNNYSKSSNNKTEKGLTGFFKSLKNIEKKRTRDKKAIKTLGIIMGIFTFCWLPFFIMYLTIPIIKAKNPDFQFSVLLERLITWIGYINSFVNPIVYALTNRDFRKAYKETLNLLFYFKCFTKFEAEHKHGQRMSHFINRNHQVKDLPNKLDCCFCFSKKAHNHTQRNNLNYSVYKNHNSNNNQNSNTAVLNNSIRFNQVEKEIVKLIENQSDINYIDESSDRKRTGNVSYSISNATDRDLSLYDDQITSLKQKRVETNSDEQPESTNKCFSRNKNLDMENDSNKNCINRFLLNKKFKLYNSLNELDLLKLSISNSFSHRSSSNKTSSEFDECYKPVRRLPNLKLKRFFSVKSNKELSDVVETSCTNDEQIRSIYNMSKLKRKHKDNLLIIRI